MILWYKCENFFFICETSQLTKLCLEFGSKTCPKPLFSLVPREMSAMIPTWFVFPVQYKGRALLVAKLLCGQILSVLRVISGTTHFHNEKALDFQTWLILYFLSLVNIVFFLFKVLCSDFQHFVTFIGLYIKYQNLLPDYTQILKMFSGLTRCATSTQQVEVHSKKRERNNRLLLQHKQDFKAPRLLLLNETWNCMDIFEKCL